MTAVAETRPAPLAGRTELGRITVADSVVTKIAAQAAAENPDAGAAAARVLGHAVPGAAWDDDARVWRIETPRGEHTANVLVGAMGNVGLWRYIEP